MCVSQLRDNLYAPCRMQEHHIEAQTRADLKEVTAVAGRAFSQAVSAWFCPSFLCDVCDRLLFVMCVNIGVCTTISMHMYAFVKLICLKQLICLVGFRIFFDLSCIFPAFARTLQMYLPRTEILSEI